MPFVPDGVPVESQATEAITPQAGFVPDAKPGRFVPDSVDSIDVSKFVANNDTWKNAKIGEPVELSTEEHAPGFKKFLATKSGDGSASRIVEETYTPQYHGIMVHPELPYVKSGERDVTESFGKPPAAAGPVGTFLRAAAGEAPAAGAGAMAMGAVRPLAEAAGQIPRVGPVVQGGITLGAGLLGALGERMWQGGVAPELEAQMASDAAANPKSAIAGGLAPQLALFSPGALARDSQGKLAIARELMNRATPAAIGAGVQAGTEIVSNKDQPGLMAPGALGRIAQSAGANALLNKPTKLGAKLMGEPHGPSIIDQVNDASKKENIIQANQAANAVQAQTVKQPEDLSGFQPVEPKRNILEGIGSDPLVQGKALVQEVNDAKFGKDEDIIPNLVKAIDEGNHKEMLSKLGLSAEESASVFKEAQDAKDAADAAVNYAGVKVDPQNITLGELVGQKVKYSGYEGTLIREPDGTMSVLRPVTTDGSPNMVEVADSGKNPATRATEVGVEPTGAMDMRINKQRGSIDPTLLYHMGAPMAGAFIGYQTGDTPDEKRRNAILGAMVGLGGSLSGHAAVYLSSKSPAFLTKATQAIAEATERADAPAQFHGVQEGAPEHGIPNFELYNLTKDIEGHPVGSTVSRQTLEGHGYRIPALEDMVGKISAETPLPQQPAFTKRVSEEVRAKPEYRRTVTSDVLKTLKRVEDAPGVDVEAKKLIAGEIERRTGLTSEYLKMMTDQDLPINALEQLRDDLKNIEHMGRLKVRDQRVRDLAEQMIHLEDMKSSQSNPLDELELTRRPGERIGLASEVGMALGNNLKSAVDYAAGVGRLLLHRDVVQDVMDGNQNYRGFISRVFGGKIDRAYNADMVVRDKWKDGLRSIVDKNKLDNASMERIGIAMIAKEDGGIQRLVDSGVPMDRISKISLTKEEQEYASAARKVLDSDVLPAITKVMREEYNIDVKPVKDYFPLQRDWENYTRPPQDGDQKFGSGEEAAMDQLVRGLQNDILPRNTTKSNQGLTIERQAKAKTPVKFNAAEILDSHLNAASHLVTHQHDLKILGRIARTPEFSAKYGALGQKYILDMLDTVARDGSPAGSKRTPWLDFIRKNTSAAILGWRLISQVKHIPNIGIATAEVGPEYLSRGMVEAARSMDSSSSAGKFLDANFKEIKQRFGGEPSVQEWVQGRSGPIRRALNKTWVLDPKNAFLPERIIDAAIARGTVIGSYMKELAAKGIDPSKYAELPYDQEAGRLAMINSRKVITSPLTKDIPHAISRGALTSGNMSAAKALFQFQNIMLRQAGYLKHDIFDLGVRNLNPRQFAAATLGFLAMIAGETYIVDKQRELVGTKTKNSPTHTPSEEAFLELAKRVPFAGNVLAARYGGTGIPIVDSATSATRAAWQLSTGSNDMGRNLSNQEKTKAKIELASQFMNAGLGIPGSSVIAQKIKNDSQR